MIRYIVRRIIISTWTLLPVMISCFYLGRLTPANIMTAASSESQGKSNTSIMEDQDPLNLKKPIHIQLLTYFHDLWTARTLFSRSYINDKKPFFRDLNTDHAMVYSALLGFFVLIFSVPMIFFFAVLSAWNRDKKWVTCLDCTFYFFATIVPWILARTIRKIFSRRFGLCAGHGVSEIYRVDFDHWFLPVLFASIYNISELFRPCRDALMEVADADYLRTARAKGLSEDQIILNHAALPAFLPCMSYFYVVIMALVSGQIIGETQFSFPGVAHRTYRAAAIRDHNFLIPMTLYTFIVGQIILFLMDLLRMALDPKVRRRLLGQGG